MGKITTDSKLKRDHIYQNSVFPPNISLSKHLPNKHLTSWKDTCPYCCFVSYFG